MKDEEIEKLENRVLKIGENYKKSDKPIRIKVGNIMDWEARDRRVEFFYGKDKSKLRK